jgi:hypothetical protein
VNFAITDSNTGKFNAIKVPKKTITPENYTLEYLGLLLDKTVIFSIVNSIYVVSYLLTSML